MELGRLVGKRRQAERSLAEKRRHGRGLVGAPRVGMNGGVRRHEWGRGRG
jgi:hypothetical protein